MKIIKKHWKEILTILLVCVLIYFFPLTNKDWIFFNKDSINSIKSLSRFELLPALIAIALSKIKIIKIVIYAISFTTITILIKNFANKKNYVLAFITLFLIFLLKDNIMFSGVISTYGFCTNFLPMLFLILILHLVIEDRLYKLPKIVLASLGLVASLFNYKFSLVLFIILIVKLVKIALKKEKDMHFIWLFIGSCLGTIAIITYNIINKNILFNGISSPLLHSIIPNIYNSDFIISLILISFLLFLSIKVFISHNGIKQVFTIFSLVSILFYSLTRLLSNDDIINYISFVIFEISSLFVIINSNNRLQFKEKIKTIYMVKWIFILLLLMGNIDSSSVLFIECLNIITIVVLIDYIFPKNFMLLPWWLVSFLILVLNIYVYRGTSIKYSETNRYIRNHLECNMNDIYLPHRYYNSHVDFLLPKTKEEKSEYILFIGYNGDHDMEYMITIDNKKELPNR